MPNLGAVALMLATEAEVKLLDGPAAEGIEAVGKARRR
jgi:hypothetical protein